MNELRDKIKDYLSVKKIRNKQRLKTIPERDILTVQLDVLISDFIQSQSTNKELQCSKECELVKCQDLHDKNKELQKEIEKYDNFLNDLTLNHALIHQISLFKESLTNKKEG